MPVLIVISLGNKLIRSRGRSPSQFQILILPNSIFDTLTLFSRDQNKDSPFLQQQISLSYRKIFIRLTSMNSKCRDLSKQRITIRNQNTHFLEDDSILNYSMRSLCLSRFKTSLKVRSLCSELCISQVRLTRRRSSVSLDIAKQVVSNDDQWNKLRLAMKSRNVTSSMQLKCCLDDLLKERLTDMEAHDCAARRIHSISGRPSTRRFSTLSSEAVDTTFGSKYPRQSDELKPSLLQMPQMELDEIDDELER